MPVSKTPNGKRRSKVFASDKQRKMYYATDGFKRQPPKQQPKRKR